MLMEAGDAAYKRKKDSNSPFQKVEELTPSIGADDHRAKNRF